MAVVNVTTPKVIPAVATVVTNKVTTVTAPTHSHQCGKCGAIWSHTEHSFGNVTDHTCPICGSGPYWNKVNSGAVYKPQYLIESNCPNGNCPNTSTRYFRR